MRKAYKYRLYPTKEQEKKIQFILERCRLLYNRLLDERRFAYETDKTTLNERTKYLENWSTDMDSLLLKI